MQLIHSWIVPQENCKAHRHSLCTDVWSSIIHISQNKDNSGSSKLAKYDINTWWTISQQ